MYMSTPWPQGELIAAEDGLDYETEEVHILRVIAEDQATTNRMSSTATVRACCGWRRGTVS